MFHKDTTITRYNLVILGNGWSIYLSYIYIFEISEQKTYFAMRLMNLWEEVKKARKYVVSLISYHRNLSSHFKYFPPGFAMHKKAKSDSDNNLASGWSLHCYISKEKNEKSLVKLNFSLIFFLWKQNLIFHWDKDFYSY